MLRNVSDTALWVAVYRAMETERPDALFRDPFARLLAGDRGEAIVRSMRRGRASAWAMIVRTAVMDEIITQTLAAGRVDMIVNLAAGLDARPWRLALPPELKWVDVDFGPILDYKQSVIGDAPPACSYEAAALDLRDASRRQKLFARLVEDSACALVISEGLLIYLEREDVSALTHDLHAARTFQYWLTDFASPRLLRLMKRTWGKRAAAADAQFRFAPPEGTAFFETRGWTPRVRRYSLIEARRLDREIPHAALGRWIMRILPARLRADIQQMAAVLLLERIAR